MIFLKPKFWKKKGLLALLIWPLSILYFLAITIKKKCSYSKKFGISVICVGNIYIGGTGKTPLSIKIAKNLISRKKKVAIIKKYYPEHLDEHKLIKEKIKSLIINKNRTKAILSSKNKGYNVAILDDGFQDHSIYKDLSILCFNNKQLIGNGMLFPSGPLRENISSIKRAKIIVINGRKNKNFEKNIHKISNKISIFYSQYIPENVSDLRNKKLLAFAGIGNPENFFDLLTSYNLNVKRKISYPDHYNFSKHQIKKIINDAKKNNLKVVTTEKDFHRIKGYGFKKINYLKLNLKIHNENKLMNKILKYL